jgi:hypothetical protein
LTWTWTTLKQTNLRSKLTTRIRFLICALLSPDLPAYPTSNPTTTRLNQDTKNPRTIRRKNGRNRSQTNIAEQFHTRSHTGACRLSFELTIYSLFRTRDDSSSPERRKSRKEKREKKSKKKKSRRNSESSPSPERRKPKVFV